MSAIDTTFHWCRQPSAINGLQTTYVSKRGSDVTGDGTAQNPYASIAKATAMATANTNIMLDDGEWNEARTSNGRDFYWWGNAKSKIIMYDKFSSNNSSFSYFLIQGYKPVEDYTGITFSHCLLLQFEKYGNTHCWARYCVLIKCKCGYGAYSNNVAVNSSIFISPRNYWNSLGYFKDSVNNVFFNSTINCDAGQNPSSICDYNNFTNNSIVATYGNAHSINDSTTGQTLADYFNYIHPNVLINPSNASIHDWLQCDFTAKAGSANIGAGEKGTTIGLNQGYTMYADNSSNDMFKASNGAVLKNVEWNSTLNGYTIVQKEKLCQGATSNTITLDSSASSVDDYYNNLFVGIVGGDGFGELFKITDYNGATKTATIDGTWTTTPTTSSVYTISGSIVSAVKDFGKVIKIKRNFSFFDNISALSNGEWSQFLTHTTTDDKQFPISSFSYEYSIDGTFWYRGTTADDLVSATNGENKVCEGVYGDCSNSYDEETAMNTTLRYVKILIHIGFNIVF